MKTPPRIFPTVWQNRPRIGHSIALLLAIFCTLVIAGEAPGKPTKIQGSVDSVNITENNLSVDGWAAAVDPSNAVVSLSIWLQDTRIYDGPFERVERRDVANASGRNDWVTTGWRIALTIPESLRNGEYKVRVKAQLDNGESRELGISSESSILTIKGRPLQLAWATWAIRITLLLMFALLCLAFLKTDRLSRIIATRFGLQLHPQQIFGSLLLLFFGGLVALGITGSSLGLAVKQVSFLQSDAIELFGEAQGARSDEWVVFTPYAIAQYNHSPPFPIINNNIGEDGQNMLVVGMAGSPVMHISSIAKPATWGFFLFDLKRALSWYWNFPFFACLFSLWAVISLISPGNWRTGFLLSLLFCVSPYVAAWSNWPAYATFFPSLALVLVVAILRSERSILPLVLGCILGLTLAGFALILYPPWQISISYVFLALMIGIVIRDELYRSITKRRLLAFGISFILAGAILFLWWHNAKEAIHAMQDTVYPGQRRAVSGGSVTLADLLRGFTNIMTLNRLNSPYNNQSEIASFTYFLLPLGFLFFTQAKRKLLTAVDVSMAAIIGMILIFMTIGFPLEISRPSLWGRVPPNRADLALGLATLLLCGSLLMRSGNSDPIRTNVTLNRTAFCGAIAWAALVMVGIFNLPQSIFNELSKGVLCALFAFVLATGYFLAVGRTKEFIYLSLGLAVATTFPFNPIIAAPNAIDIKVSSDIRKAMSDSAANARILVLDTQVPSMYLLANGLAVTSGVFYYPQKSFWARLDETQKATNVYNRYQHLIFTGGPVKAPEQFHIETPSLDHVRVILDMKNFDFRRTGANMVVAPKQREHELLSNPTMSLVSSEDGWSWYQVKNASHTQ